MEKYVVYDGVNDENIYCDTEAEALGILQEIINDGVEDGYPEGLEWIEGVEDSWVAEITYEIKMIEDENDIKDNKKHYKMIIQEV